MNRLHRRVEPHAPSPEQRTALRGSTPIGNLIDFSISTVTTGGQNGCAVHCKQDCRSIEEGDREHMEWVVEQITVTEGESGRPI